MEHRFDQLERGQSFSELDPQRCDASRELTSSGRRRDLQALAEQRDQRPGVTVALVQPLERRVDAGITRAELVQPFEIVERSRRVAGEVLRGHCRLAQELDAQRRCELAGESAIVEIEKRRPAARGIEGQLQAVESPARAR
jgi:hypothetical protein